MVEVRRQTAAVTPVTGASGGRTEEESTSSESTSSESAAISERIWSKHDPQRRGALTQEEFLVWTVDNLYPQEFSKLVSAGLWINTDVFLCLLIYI